VRAILPQPADTRKLRGWFGKPARRPAVV